MPMRRGLPSSTWSSWYPRGMWWWRLTTRWSPSSRFPTRTGFWRRPAIRFLNFSVATWRAVYVGLNAVPLQEKCLRRKRVQRTHDVPSGRCSPRRVGLKFCPVQGACLREGASAISTICESSPS